MTEHQIGELLLEFALLFALTYLLAGLLERVHIPGILGALFVGMVIHYLPLGGRLLSPPLSVPISFLAELGVLFLLFFIGLQIDLEEMKELRGDIVWLTVLNTAFPFVFGIIVMLMLGYGWILALVIGLTRMPTAEAVIVPILDEFKLIRTRVGSFIIGAGVLDDVVEVIVISVVSIWIGKKTGQMTAGITGVVAALVIFVLLSWISYRWIIPVLARWLPSRPRNLVLLSMVVMLGLGGFSEFGNLGMVVGAIVAGTLMRPTFNRMKGVGEQVTQAVRSMSYGFLGVIFFFWVGLNADIGGMVKEPVLAILLFLAAFLGKLIGVFFMVPMGKITIREAWTIGIGLNARLTTEIIVAQLLFTAGIIDIHLFTALVSASAFSTLAVPLTFVLLVRLWGKQLRIPIEESQPEGGSNVA